MSGLTDWLASESFMPHGYCFLWRPEILWLHVISDVTVMIAYYSIPLAFLYIMRKRSDIPYKWVLALFTTFIFLCGSTHLMGVLTIWKGVYLAEGILKAITAAVSIATAILILPLIPRILEAFDYMKLLEERARAEREQ